MTQLTGHNRLTRMFLPAVDALVPREEIDRRKQMHIAIGQDGMINPDAIPPNANHLHNEIYEHTGATNSSTTDWVTAATLPFSLPEGRWQVFARCNGRVDNASSLSVDVRLVVGPNISQTFNTPATANGSGLFPRANYLMDGPADFLIVAQVKSNSGGTSGLRRLALEYDAFRR